MTNQGQERLILEVNSGRGVQKRIQTQSSVSVGSEQVRLLAESVVNRLPRELRDQIYDYLWDSNEAQKLGGCISSELLQPRSLLRGPSPHWIRRELVGTQFASEALQALFEHNDFCLVVNYVKDQAGVIQKVDALLEQDFFDVGLAVGELNIRNFAVYLAPPNSSDMKRQLMKLSELKFRTAQFMLGNTVATWGQDQADAVCSEAFLLNTVQEDFEKIGTNTLHFFRMGVRPWLSNQIALRREMLEATGFEWQVIIDVHLKALLKGRLRPYKGDATFVPMDTFQSLPVPIKRSGRRRGYSG